VRYLCHSEALEYVAREAGLSRETFDLNIRPRLVERKYSDRVSRFSVVAIDAAMDNPAFTESEAGEMFFKRKTIADALEHTWSTIWYLQKGSKTQRYLVDLVIAERGTRPLSKVDYNFIEAWVIELRGRKLAESTIARRLTCLMRALKVAKAKGWLAAIPDVPPLGERTAVVRYVSPGEEKALLAAAKAHKWPLVQRIMPRVIEFLIDVGCRESELVRARPQFVTDDGIVFPDRKNGSTIKVPLTARARSELHELFRDEWWQRMTRDVHDADRDTRDIARKNLKDWITHRFSEIRDAAGLMDVTVHVLRHTTASRLIQAGFELVKVRDWLGHKDIKTTLIYAHLAPTQLNAGKAILERLQLPEDDNVIDFDKRRISED
jgi:site-specific recombinase XerD